MDILKEGSLNNSYGWYSALSQANLLLSFKGEFNPDLVKAILILTQNREHIKSENVVMQTRLFGVLVECLQNICKHGVGNVEGSDLKPGIVLIGRGKECFKISTGNLIHNNSIDDLKQKLDRINDADDKGLKEMQKEVLFSTDGLTKKSGAGIGLIYIARRSGERLDYDFKKMHDDLSFFSFEVNLPITD